VCLTLDPDAEMRWLNVLYERRREEMDEEEPTLPDAPPYRRIDEIGGCDII